MTSSHPRTSGRPHRIAPNGTLLAAGLAVLLAACGGARTAAPAKSPRPVPEATQATVHRALHRLDGLCRRPGRSTAALRSVTTTALELDRRYPAARGYSLQVDDEQATSLSVLLVVRQALRTCAPAQAARIDAVLPRRIRGALAPLGR